LAPVYCAEVLGTMEPLPSCQRKLILSTCFSLVCVPICLPVKALTLLDLMRLSVDEEIIGRVRFLVIGAQRDSCCRGLRFFGKGPS
jgi:hypothetical protein